MSRFPLSTPLHSIRSFLQRAAREPGGTECPACFQHVQIYRRTINSGMARSLIAMYRIGGTDWIHLPTQLGARSREEGKLAYWELVEEELARRPDGGRAGYWRVTPKGELFVRNQLVVPKYALVYNGRFLGYEGTDRVGIRDALGKKFDYTELMTG